MPKWVLVTGAHGFIGRYISRAAASTGYGVIGIGHGDSDPATNSAWGITRFNSCDVTLKSLREYAGRPDVIFHCAGSGSVARSVAAPREDFQRTVETLSEVLEFTRLHSPNTKVIIPSSAGVYGSVDLQPIRVNSDLAPTSPYGVHKKIAEDLAKSYAQSFGVKVAMVRLFSVYGEELRKQLLWDACRKLSSGDSIFFGTGSETRDWLHVADATELMFAAAGQASELCPIVNGGSGQAVTIKEVVDLIASELRTTIRPSFNGITRAGDPMHYQADIREALSWGWRPTRRWAEEIPNYVRWFQGEAL